jgi:hypothetical protein
MRELLPANHYGLQSSSPRAPWAITLQTCARHAFQMATMCPCHTQGEALQLWWIWMQWSHTGMTDPAAQFILH